MKLFKAYTMQWWEFGLLKMSLIAFGILIGSNWPNYFCGLKKITVLWAVFILPALYLVIVTFKQAKTAGNSR